MCTRGYYEICTDLSRKKELTLKYVDEFGTDGGLIMMRYYLEEPKLHPSVIHGFLDTIAPEDRYDPVINQNEGFNPWIKLTTKDFVIAQGTEADRYVREVITYHIKYMVETPELKQLGAV